MCDIVVESPDPHIACRRVLDAALYEWEERMSADNITVLVVEFEWNEDGAVPVAVDHAVEHASAVAAGFRCDSDRQTDRQQCVGDTVPAVPYSGVCVCVRFMWGGRCMSVLVRTGTALRSSTCTTS